MFVLREDFQEGIGGEVLADRIEAQACGGLPMRP